MVKGLIIGCLALAVLAAMGLAACVGLAVYVNQPVEGAAVEVSMPEPITVGQEFDLTITVNNNRADKVFGLTDIDMSTGFVGGFQVVKVTPSPQGSTAVPVTDMQSWTFGQDIAAGQKQTFTWKLRAGAQPGIYQGQLQVWEGMRSIDQMISAEIKAE